MNLKILSEELNKIVELDYLSKDLFIEFKTKEKQIKKEIIEILVEYFNNNFPNNYTIKLRGNKVLFFFKNELSIPFFQLEILSKNLSYKIDSFHSSNLDDIERYLDKIKILNFFLEHQDTIFEKMAQYQSLNKPILDSIHQQLAPLITQFSKDVTQFRSKFYQHISNVIKTKTKLSFSIEDNITSENIDCPIPLLELQLIEESLDSFDFEIKDTNGIRKITSLDLDLIIKELFLNNVFSILKINNASQRTTHAISTGNNTSSSGMLDPK